MIFATGDTHGDFTRFSMDIFPEQKEMTKDDFVIVCGDFGIWDNSKRERYWLKWLDEKQFTTLFVDGNHENYDLLASYPVSDWHGGKVQRIGDSVIHLIRGQAYEICGKHFFTMGGASSHDIKDGILEPDAPDFIKQRKKLNAQGAIYRVNHVSWWKEELPCDAEYETAVNNLERCHWKTDYIITHCCPTSIANILGNGEYQPDRLTDFFETIKNRCDYGYWIFGHYHENRVIEKKFVLLYEQIVLIEE
ncbi:conserved hypothetical protein [Desulfofarcimen acetoxidans DSM 771]|uniref:Calcineurin-like phosphoesterase domain-containing protein n=1 Tax=Desulfofarcimen acetoxidans (strain ATCC 49208 / DSM 771 / KCTC 5769 / VKM B-1644 / 5575) TaxID=485916 RepID=C8W5M5_DESAS|nr:metallophosphoesterase family protein [Desulfofarcimen acetoxidans]ACV64025.1 conserved hypothetical protein [Desulfofarcimen acetoxidans DSM 771]